MRIVGDGSSRKGRKEGQGTSRLADLAGIESLAVDLRPLQARDDGPASVSRSDRDESKGLPKPLMPRFQSGITDLTVFEKFTDSICQDLRTDPEFLIAVRKLLFISIFTVALALTSNASDQLAFDVQEDTDATTYNLQLRQGKSVRTIWSRRVALINGKKPYDWCRLLAWESNEHGLLALLENNEIWGMLLQFNSNGDLVAELEAGGSWLGDIRRGGSIKLEPFDKIEATSPDGSITKFLIRNGKLADKDGRMFERPQPLQVGEKSFATTPASVPTPPVVQAPVAAETQPSRGN